MRLSIQVTYDNKRGNGFVVEDTPKGYIVNEKTGEKTEVKLTEEEILLSYSQRIAREIEEGKSLVFKEEGGSYVVLNTAYINSFRIRKLGD